MPSESHGMDCDCGCCGVEEEPKSPGQGGCVCPACGKKMPQEAGQVCGERKCPSCGAALKPGQ